MKSFELFDEFGVENCIIRLIEQCPCSSRAELERREGQIQQEYECINKNVAGRTRTEYRESRKEYLQNKTILIKKAKSVLTRKGTTNYTKMNTLKKLNVNAERKLVERK